MESWDVAIVVASEKLDDLWAKFTLSEKAQAVGNVLQGRMDALLEVG